MVEQICSGSGRMPLFLSGLHCARIIIIIIILLLLMLSQLSVNKVYLTQMVSVNSFFCELIRGRTRISVVSLTNGYFEQIALVMPFVCQIGMKIINLHIKNNIQSFLKILPIKGLTIRYDHKAIKISS